MMRNHITLIGRVGTYAEITKFDNGSKVARFSMSTERSYRASNGKIKQDIEWHRLFAWGDMAQFIESYAEKGKKIAIHGRLVKRTFLTKDGARRSVTEVEVKNFMGI
jgi:single-strand DNA-binding protein